MAIVYTAFLSLFSSLGFLACAMVRPRVSITTENVFLRRQLALYVERRIKPRRADRVERLSLAMLWRYRSGPGRPRIPLEVRALIRRMARENVLWGKERIANELLLNLGIRLSPRTVRKYMPKRPHGTPRGDQRWRTFLRNHAKGIIACDFLLSVTVAFRSVYVFVIIDHGTRKLIHFNVTSNPTAAWTLQQLREAVGDQTQHQYLIRDRDQIYSREFDVSAK